MFAIEDKDELYISSIDMLNVHNPGWIVDHRGKLMVS